MYSSNHSHFISVRFNLNDLIHYNPNFSLLYIPTGKILPSLHNYDTKKVITKQKISVRDILNFCIFGET